MCSCGLAVLTITVLVFESCVGSSTDGVLCASGHCASSHYSNSMDEDEMNMLGMSMLQVRSQHVWPQATEDQAITAIETARSEHDRDISMLMESPILERSMFKFKEEGSRMHQLTTEEFRTLHRCKEEPSIAAGFKTLDESNTILDESFLESNWQDMLVTIENQRISNVTKGIWAPLRADSYMRLLNELLQEVELPDMKFSINLADKADAKLGIFKVEGKWGKDLFMLPRSLPDFGRDLKASIEEGQSKCPAIAQHAVFRGATQPGCTHGVRYELVRLSMRRPDLLDAKFNTVINCWNKEESINETFSKQGMMSEWMWDRTARCHNSVVVPDGISLADRVPWQLTYGVPVILLHGSKVQDEFWYGEAESKGAFLKATPDTLELILEALKSNATKRAIMGKRAVAYAEKHLTESRLKCYLHSSLTEYAKRQQRNAHIIADVQ